MTDARRMLPAYLADRLPASTDMGHTIPVPEQELRTARIRGFMNTSLLGFVDSSRDDLPHIHRLKSLTALFTPRLCYLQDPRQRSCTVLCSLRAC